MEVSIQSVNENENSIVINLLEKLYMELGEEKESLEFLNQSLLEKIIQSGLTQIFIAKSNETVVGLLTLTESQAIYAGGKYGVIDEMYVLPEYRSHKIGELLVNEAKKIANENGWKRIDVTAPTEERWKSTADFYEKCGFVFTGPKLKYQLSNSEF